MTSIEIDTLVDLDKLESLEALDRAIECLEYILQAIKDREPCEEVLVLAE